MATNNAGLGLTPAAAFMKRAFDVCFAFIGLALTWWIILLTWLVASFDTGKSGFFCQERVGLSGRRFKVIKIRTMRDVNGVATVVTTAADPRITPIGRLLRKAKLDELPQLINVLLGHMSFVGPRPDVPGFADLLQGEDRVVLTVRPGITGPATLKYRNEEELLAAAEEPERLNREVIYPDKVRINKMYVLNYRFRDDIGYIFRTILSR